MKARTPKEVEVLLAICLNGMREGKTLKEIGAPLNLTGNAIGMFLTKYWRPNKK